MSDDQLYILDEHDDVLSVSAANMKPNMNSGQPTNWPGMLRVCRTGMLRVCLDSQSLLNHLELHRDNHLFC